MVSQQLLIELKEIIKAEYGQDLEMEKVSRIGNDMVNYFDLLAKMQNENNQSNAN